MTDDTPAPRAPLPTRGEVAAMLRDLPHRCGQLLVDRVTAVEAGRSIRGVKNVSMNEPFFQGHFPGFPVMPGVLMIEALLQLSILLACLSGAVGARGAASIHFTGIRGARFKRQVVPGDRLDLEAEMVGGIECFKVRALVGGELACEAELCAERRDAAEA